MAIPSRLDAERLLASFELPEGVVVHSRGVSRVAVEAARLLAVEGAPVDPLLVEIAALLHDIDKLATREDGSQHGLVGARWLLERGYPELAAPVAAHPIGCLLDPARTPRGWASVALAVADRHVGQRFMSIDERIDDQAARYPAYRATLEAAREPARAMEAQLAAAAGLGAEELVARLRAAWQAGEAEAA